MTDVDDARDERTPGGAILMDGIRLHDEITEQLAAEMISLGSPRVCLGTVLVGDDRPSQIYVRSKHKQAEKAGMVSQHIGLTAAATQAEVEEAVAGMAADAGVHGILVQLPLPDGLDPEPVLDLVPPDKDIDGLTERSMGRLLRGRPGHVPCTPKGVMRLLVRYGTDVSGARAVVIGRSTLVGLPLSLLLGRKGADATVTLAHSRTRDIVEVCREADIIVGAAGTARMITATRQPRRDGRRRRCLPDRGRHRRRRRLRRRPGGSRCHHAEARRHRPDDHRLPAGEHARGGPHAGPRCRCPDRWPRVGLGALSYHPRATTAL